MHKFKIDNLSLMKKLFTVGVESVIPAILINNVFHNNKLKYNNLDIDIGESIYIVGFGKAALGFMNPLYDILKTKIRRAIFSVPIPIESELILKPELFKVSPELLEITKIFYGSRSNVPTNETLKASREIYKLIKTLSKEDTLIVVITGGGSALLCLPEPGINIQDIIHVTDLLAKAGASIVELNTIRRKLDILKGGGIVELSNCNKIISLILSDVIGDDISIIASGPTVINENYKLSPLDIINKFNLLHKMPSNVIEFLKSKQRNEFATFNNVYNCVIGNNRVALNTISIEAAKHGLETFILSNTLSGDCELRSQELIQFLEVVFLYSREQREKIREKITTYAQKMLFDGSSVDNLISFFSSKDKNNGICLLIGSETPVKIVSNISPGLGGRCTHMALSIACCMENSVLKDSPVTILFGATDGMDGATDCAGAIVYPQMFIHSKNQKVLPNEYLENFNSYNFFKTFDKGKYFLQTGMTGTNVMDIIVVIIPNEN